MCGHSSGKGYFVSAFLRRIFACIYLENSCVLGAIAPTRISPLMNQENYPEILLLRTPMRIRLDQPNKKGLQTMEKRGVVGKNLFHISSVVLFWFEFVVEKGSLEVEENHYNGNFHSPSQSHHKVLPSHKLCAGISPMCYSCFWRVRLLHTQSQTHA